MFRAIAGVITIITGFGLSMYSNFIGSQYIALSLAADQDITEIIRVSMDMAPIMIGSGIFSLLSLKDDLKIGCSICAAAMILWAAIIGSQQMTTNYISTCAWYGFSLFAAYVFLAIRYFIIKMIDKIRRKKDQEYEE